MDLYKQYFVYYPLRLINSFDYYFLEMEDSTFILKQFIKILSLNKHPYKN